MPRGSGQRAPKGSQGKAGDPSIWKVAGAEQESTEVFVGKGWVSALLFCRLLGILVFGFFWEGLFCLFVYLLVLFCFFKRDSLIATQVSLIYTKIIKDVSLGKTVSTATSCFCLIQVICL